ncbi:Alpha/Beta hydrolase protein [Aspergillus varians]
MQLAIYAISVSARGHFPPRCDATCQAVYNQSLPIDASFWAHRNVTNDAFYETPENFSDYSVGDMVKWEDIGPDEVSGSWWVPSGLSLSRLFYVSQDVDLKPLPATGFVLIPYQNPLGPNKPFRVVVWAHGTAGYTPQCAPSNDKRLQYHWTGPFALAQQGYVVIAPDYAGLGSTIPQGFMYNAGIPHAADISLAVKATRGEFPDLITKEWVVVGHSEGGLSAWRTAEREANMKLATGSLIGTVAIAPAVEVMSLVPWVIEKAKGGALQEVFLPFMLQSINRLFSSFNWSIYVTDKLAELSDLSTDACLNLAIPLLINLTLTDMYRNGANFTSAPEVKTWNEKYHGKGAHNLQGPMLVVHGEKDFILPHKHIEGIFDKQCEAHPTSAARYTLLPGVDHDGVVVAAQSVYFSWIADRFNNKEIKPGCIRDQAHATTDRFSTTEQAWLSGGQILVE